ncbi:DNA binding protein, partial [Murine adenovirus 1]
MSCSRPVPPQRTPQQQVYETKRGGVKRSAVGEASTAHCGKKSRAALGPRSSPLAPAVSGKFANVSGGDRGSEDVNMEPEPQTEVPPRFESSDEDDVVFTEAGVAEEEEACWQTARELLHKMCLVLKVDGKQCTFLPNAQTAELFRKLSHSWLLQQKLVPSLTFSTLRSFTMQMGRFVFAMLLQAAGISPVDFAAHTLGNVTGVAAWKHNCSTTLHCLHGTAMSPKDHQVELDVTTEGGQRALKEQGSAACVQTNRWGRSVVRVTYDAVVCAMDASVAFNQPTNKSCGFCFTDAKKALKGFKQAIAFQQALYPQAPG